MTAMAQRPTATPEGPRFPLGSRVIAPLLALLAVLVTALAAAWTVGGWTGVGLAAVGLPILTFGVLEFLLVALSVGADFAGESTKVRCRRATAVVERLVFANSMLLIALFLAIGAGVVWVTLASF